MSATSRLPIPVAGPGHSSFALADLLPPRSRTGCRTGAPAFQISGATAPREYDAGAAPGDSRALNEARRYPSGVSLGVTGDGMSGQCCSNRNRFWSAARVEQVASSRSSAARVSAPNDGRSAVAGGTRAVGSTLRHSHSARVLPAGAESVDSPPRADVVSPRRQPGASDAATQSRTESPSRRGHLAASEPMETRTIRNGSARSRAAGSGPQRHRVCCPSGAARTRQPLTTSASVEIP